MLCGKWEWFPREFASDAHQPVPGALANGHGAANGKGIGTANGRSSAGSQGSDHSVHRSETLTLLPAHTHAHAQTRIAPTGMHLLPSTGTSGGSGGSYHEREREYDGASSLYRTSQHGPTPLKVAMLPGVNEVCPCIVMLMHAVTGIVRGMRRA